MVFFSTNTYGAHLCRVAWRDVLLRLLVALQVVVLASFFSCGFGGYWNDSCIWYDTTITSTGPPWTGLQHGYFGWNFTNLLSFEYHGTDFILHSHDFHHFWVRRSYITNTSPVLDELMQRALVAPLPAPRSKVKHHFLWFSFVTWLPLVILLEVFSGCSPVLFLLYFATWSSRIRWWLNCVGRGHIIAFHVLRVAAAGCYTRLLESWRESAYRQHLLSQVGSQAILFSLPTYGVDLPPRSSKIDLSGPPLRHLFQAHPTA